MLHDLQKVIDEADDTETDREKHHRKDLRIAADINEADDHDGQYEHEATHRRCALFLKMCLRSIVPDLLSEFQLVKLRNGERHRKGYQHKAHKNRNNKIKIHNLTPYINHPLPETRISSES